MVKRKKKFTKTIASLAEIVLERELYNSLYKKSNESDQHKTILWDKTNEIKSSLMKPNLTTIACLVSKIMKKVANKKNKGNLVSIVNMAIHYLGY